MPVHAERLPGRRTLPPALFIGGALFAFILLGSLAAPIFTPFRFDAMDVMSRMRPPDATHWLGTDEFGRDILSRVLHGGSTSIGLGIAATAFAFAIGVPLGLLGGYIQGRWDDVIMRTVDILVSIPPIMLGLLILATTTPGVWKAALAVGIIYVPILVRLSRSVALSLAQEEFILAARTRGEGLPWILFREILPNALPPLVVETSLRVSFAILLGSVFSFLGLGTQPPSSDWGLMIAEARAYLEQAPWIALAPGIALCATIISINLIGEGLRQFLDVRSRPGE